MSPTSSGGKHWRGRLLDGATLLMTLAALTAAGGRYLRPAPGETAETSRVEEKLVGHLPGAVELIADGTGERRAVSFAGASPRLVMLFRTTCPACQATKPRWEELTASLPEGERAYAITQEPAGGKQAFFGSPRVQVWHVVNAARYLAAYPSPYVPTTLVVGTDGRIQYAKIGTLGRGDMAEISRLLRR